MVRQFLNKLEANKASVIDGISATILKYCGDYMVLPITFIINNSIAKGIFPTVLKETYVLPLHKGAEKEDPNNYRPISVLPTISKIFERHLSNQILAFLSKHDLLATHQSPFREGHSCQTALIRLTDE